MNWSRVWTARPDRIHPVQVIRDRIADPVRRTATLAWTRRPSLLHGKRPAMGMTPRRALWVLIVISTALRLLWAAVLEAGNDEAYHYLYAVHPDLSYFDHPPMLMLTERVGMMSAGGVDRF